jgi:LuxR family maltose regulon positive regulatory protein
MSDLLANKLRFPTIPSKRVLRSNIIKKLNEGLELSRPLTLVSAPAGFGKTSCISEWASALDGWQVAWLSLDPSDDDPERFFAYFLAALQKINKDLGQEIDGVIRSGQLPPSEVLSTVLINDILKLRGRMMLVLDDFHVIQDPFIYQVLEHLIANIPSPLNLVLITREDPPLPLARLRANNQLTEIRAGDLRFRYRDVDHFLNGVMGLSLSRADLSVLEEKTEGWIVGLQLAGLSIRDRPDPSRFIAALSGSHRFILSYLTEQVLDQQRVEIQQFLLETSILDRLNADLCNAVCQRSDSYAFLEQLLNANLFLISLDEERQWYRYHHLFAELLRDLQKTFPKVKTIELHRRASHWYVQANMVNEAIQHALAAEDYAMVVNLLENHAMEMIMQGYAKTVNGWVQAIPKDWGSPNPRTNLAFAWMHLLRGDYAHTSMYLERLEEYFSSSRVNEGERWSLNAEWLVMQSLIFIMEGKITESLASAEEALRILPEGNSRVLSLAYFGRASAFQAMHNFDLALKAYQKAIQYGRASGNIIAEMMSVSGLAQLAFDQGQLHLAIEIATPVSARLEASGSLPPISTVVYGILGQVHYQWCQIERARSFFQHALQLSTLGGYSSGMISCRVLLSRLYQLEGDLESASSEIQNAVDMIKVDTPGYVRQETVAQQVRVYLARNIPTAAEMALQEQGFSFQNHFTFPELPLDQNINNSIGLLYNSSLRVLLYQAHSTSAMIGLRRGIELANQLAESALREKYIVIALETLLLRAQMHALLGDIPASTADYVKALELAEPEGFMGVFVEQDPQIARALADLARGNQLEKVQPDFVPRILDALSRSYTSLNEQPSPDLPAENRSSPLIEPLTERELQVLHLMAEGLKYKEIASRLVVSQNTVRFHIKSLYSKLNVSSRAQAVAAARQLRIL